MPVSDTEITRVHGNLRTAIAGAQKFHENAMMAFRLDEKLKSDPAFLEEFKKDPMGVAKQEGIIVPDGFHCHFINENNEYFPPEGDPISQLKRGKSGAAWGRVEIRYAVGPGCYAFCGVCKPD